jgi:hypothetical protein
MRLLVRSALVLMMFIGVGLVAAHAVMADVQQGPELESQLRPTAWMAGLFAGGAAGLMTAIGLMRHR